MEIECQVCLNESEGDTFVQCPCGFKACRKCCATFAVPTCMKCGTNFTKQFAQKHNIVDIFKAYHQKLTWERECSLLPSTQPFLEWEDTVTKLKKRLRFGERVVFPEKPKMFLNTSTSNPIFACPGSDCRGFVGGSHCGTCKKQVCTQCREFMQKQTTLNNENETEPSRKPSTLTATNNKNNSSKVKHECEPALVASIRSIEQEAKSCPRCRAQIFRIEGCNHMFCTNCRTHFDWETGRVLASSSNHHYDTTAIFSTNVATIANAKNSTDIEQQCNTDPFTDAIPSSVLDSFIFVNQASSQSGDRKNAFRALWTEPVSARFLLRKRLNGFETEFQYQEALLRIRLMFLRRQISETQAKARVLLEDEKHEKMFRQRGLLELYLNTCNDLQRMVYLQQTNEMVNEVLKIYKNLIDTCQDASLNTRAELGGECLSFTCDFESQMPHVTL